MRISDWSSDVCSADAAQLALGFGGLAALRKALVVDHLQGLVHRLVVVADVVLQGAGRLVGELVRLDAVAPAQHARVDLHLAPCPPADATAAVGRLSPPAPPLALPLARVLD